MKENMSLRRVCNIVMFNSAIVFCFPYIRTLNIFCKKLLRRFLLNIYRLGIFLFLFIAVGDGMISKKSSS